MHKKYDAPVRNTTLTQPTTEPAYVQIMRNQTNRERPRDPTKPKTKPLKD